MKPKLGVVEAAETEGGGRLQEEIVLHGRGNGVFAQQRGARGQQAAVEDAVGHEIGLHFQLDTFRLVGLVHEPEGVGHIGQVQDVISVIAVGIGTEHDAAVRDVVGAKISHNGVHGLRTCRTQQ